MAVSLIKITPASVTAIGDDGKNKASNLFDQDLTTRWSYKGKFAYNLIKLSGAHILDNMTFHWYMKKGEKRQYDFGIYLSETDIGISQDFVKAKNEIQGYYDHVATMKPLTNEGKETSTVSMSGRKALCILVIYTKSSSKKDWMSVNEIEITAAVDVNESECPEGFKKDPISGECIPITPDTDEDHVDINKVKYWDNIEYISENHTYHKNFRSDGSMRLDVEPADMGGVCRYDKECVVFLKCQKTKGDERCNFKSDGGPHTPDHPEWGRCEDFGIQFNGEKAIFEQELRHEKGGGGPYIDRDAVDTSHLKLPPFNGIWIGHCWRDRRVIRKSDNKLLGRILEYSINTNPFDPNRNVQNQNWIDSIAVFLDKGQYKDEKGNPFPIIDKPVNPKKYQDTVRVDGQDAGTFGVRFFRYCGVKPIMVDNEEEMDAIFKEMREGDSDGENPPDNKAPVVKVKEALITVTQDKQQVTLDASESTDPEGSALKYQWKQMSGTPNIPIPETALTSATVIFNFDKTYPTSNWQVSVSDDKGNISTGLAKIVNSINQNPEDTKYIEPKYQADLEKANLYFRMKDYVKGKPSLADGKRVDSDAKKWDLGVRPDGSVYYKAATGRLKIWALEALEDKDLWKMVEAQNPNWSYEKARELGYWGAPGFRNVECTAILKFDKKQTRKDAFVGWVVRSCFHDLKTDKESKDRPFAYHAGSSYHSNIQITGDFEEKHEFGHAIYGNAKKIYKYMNNVPDLTDKKVGWKFCLQDTMFNGKPVVLSQSYLTLHPDDTEPEYAPWWATLYFGDECKSSQIDSSNKSKDKVDKNPGLMQWDGDYVILKSNDSNLTFYDIEIKPIIPIPEIKNI